MEDCPQQLNNAPSSSVENFSTEDFYPIVIEMTREELFSCFQNIKNFGSRKTSFVSEIVQNKHWRKT